jgi:hypothetical protein
MSVPSRLAALRLFMKVFPPLGSSDDGGILRQQQAKKVNDKQEKESKKKGKEKARNIKRNVFAL